MKPDALWTPALAILALRDAAADEETARAIQVQPITFRNSEQSTTRADWKAHLSPEVRAHRSVIYKIGEALHREGGSDLMRQAYDDLYATHPRAAVLVERIWDGIGSWLA